MSKDNVIPLWKSSVPEDSLNEDLNSVDFTFVDPESAENIFNIMNFLSNREVLKERFKPEVTNFLKNQDKFKEKGFTIAYNEAFDDLICSLIKNEIVSHFSNLTPEDINLVCDKEVIKFLTEGFYFDPTNYEGATDGNSHTL